MSNWKLYSKEEFKAKINYEGGIDEMFWHSGKAKDYDLPPEFRRKWEALCDLISDIEAAMEPWPELEEDFE